MFPRTREGEWVVGLRHLWAARLVTPEERKGVVLPFPPDESWPVHKNPFEYIMRPTHLAVVVVPDAGKGIVRAI